MRTLLTLTTLVLLSACGSKPAGETPTAAAQPPADAAPAPSDAAAGTPVASTSPFTLTSPDLKAGQKIADAQVFNSFGCSGKNISPALAWDKAPAGTKSYALMVYDPDAPTGSGWWHWVVYNIPASATSLPANAGDPKANLLPAGAAQGKTDFGSSGYGGPCPPAGDTPHHYYFRLHALKVEHLDIPDGATAALVGFNVNANTIATAELMALYSR